MDVWAKSLILIQWANIKVWAKLWAILFWKL